MRKTLDSIIQAALDEALAALAARAKDLVFEAAQAALEARVKALLEEEGLTPALAAPARAKAKVQATLEATPEEGEATPKATPRKRKAKATTPATTPEDDLAAILGAIEVALQRYKGTTTPRGKPLEEVLLRRVRKTLQYAKELGRKDIRLLAERAMALVNIDPMATAMGSWKALAERLGLPVPVSG